MSPHSTRTLEPTTRDPARVREMFGRIARRYDLANHLLSAGADFSWRSRAARIVENWKPQTVLDLATGSGDLALAMQRRLPHARVIAADFSEEMLAVARRKGVAEVALADALNLPFPSASFDAVTVAFGLRNMADWTTALREMARVLRVDGNLLVLDFSVPRGALTGPYRFYLHRILPLAASLITGQKDAYDYLGGSIEAFPCGDEMVRLIQENGFRAVTATPLTAGIATIYAGMRRD